MNAKLRPAHFLALLLLSGCTSSPATPESPEAAPPAPTAAPAAPLAWTQDFSRQILIVADDIRIVGPSGLLGHVAVQQDPGNHSYDVKTTKEGLRVESLAKTGALQPIRGNLDALSLAATRSLTVLESITAVDVVVEASGEVYYRDVEAGKESRSARLRLVGRPQR